MVDNRNVKIYVLKHPDTLEIRYVGKTVRSLSRRLGNHVANAKGNRHNKHLSNWILNLLREGKRPVIELLETCTQDTWQEREQYWIAYYPNLINLTQGGDGCLGLIHNQEAIEKLRKANTGRRHSQEFKDNMSNRLKGVHLSEEHKGKMALPTKERKLLKKPGRNSLIPTWVSFKKRNLGEKEVNLFGNGGLNENLLKI